MHLKDSPRKKWVFHRDEMMQNMSAVTIDFNDVAKRIIFNYGKGKS